MHVVAGTCVNNEYCVMFKSGAFKLGATVCPIAIKYNKIFVDAFWNSKRQSFSAHLVRCAGRGAAGRGGGSGRGLGHTGEGRGASERGCFGSACR